MKKKTKILATIGPASDKLSTIEGLIRAGADVFRMNFSHGDHAYHSKVLAKIRQAEKKTGKKVGVLQDICGPKIRVGKLKNDFELKSGDLLEFSRDEIVGKKLEKGLYTLSINQPKVLDLLKEDEYIYLYDGNIRARVVEVGKHIVAKVENKGILSSNKGVNFPNTKININVITKKDEKDLLWGIENGVDFIAISFVQTSNDVLQAREIIEKNGGKVSLFAKIEKFDAVENIDDILKVSDGLMVARGDLGIEVPYYKVPGIQKMLIKKANAASKPVITATQMLLSMAKNETATRAEISDVANAVLDGTDAVMLSEESAVGANPVKAVITMTNTIKETEKLYPYNKFDDFKFLDETDIVTSSSARLAQDLQVKAMIILTSSGQSAKKIARYRIKSDILAVTHDEKTARTLNIVWGVNPVMSVEKKPLSKMLSSVVKKGLSSELINLRKTYVVTAGYPTGVAGNTNFIRILHRDQLEYYRDFEE
ncbi:MAG: pyruvate kinase [Proteobacteria bacterium]|nr:MAG: pyruvate kinase [Pseudomonadota bacterium]